MHISEAMFQLKSVLKNKALTIVLACGFFQIACDLAGSVTFFPILHFGMYSEVAVRPESYKTFELVVDGQKLRPLDFRIHLWETICKPLYIYNKIEDTNDFEKDKGYIKKGLSVIGFHQLYAKIESNLSNVGEDKKSFTLRYKKHLSQILDKPVFHLDVFQNEYHYRNGRYFLINQTLLLHD